MINHKKMHILQENDCEKKWSPKGCADVQMYTL